MDIKQSKKHCLEELKQIAHSHGGKCLSDEYINSTTKLTFQCKCGHIWQTTPTVIKHAKAWCPTCNFEKMKYTLDDLHKLAASRGGKHLETEYVLTRIKTRWQCAKGHIWKAAARDVRRGTWCKQCADDRRRGTIEEMQKIARLREGECLSTQYTDRNTKLLWKCRMGHTWMAKPNHIKEGSWCPSCNYLSRCKHDKAKRKYLSQTQKK